MKSIQIVLPFISLTVTGAIEPKSLTSFDQLPHFGMTFVDRNTAALQNVEATIDQIDKNIERGFDPVQSGDLLTREIIEAVCELYPSHTGDEVFIRGSANNFANMILQIAVAKNNGTYFSVDDVKVQLNASAGKQGGAHRTLASLSYAGGRIHVHVIKDNAEKSTPPYGFPETHQQSASYAMPVDQMSSFQEKPKFGTPGYGGMILLPGRSRKVPFALNTGENAAMCFYFQTPETSDMFSDEALVSIILGDIENTINIQKELLC